eukprot:CAMPEP_0194279718 /NCGR_PEP_ID=MMETSP0169-20130528/14085_1 /TAXON_ID=218684 /ORGANISM="Corethron pennatum, Strain L29A3" /LENGTH=322 /DNA_ID=CAMNT_0039024175 /DNA_START=266 /DNA_END=1234 /DNA_ORIENTATION=-
MGSLLASLIIVAAFPAAALCMSTPKQSPIRPTKTNKITPVKYFGEQAFQEIKDGPEADNSGIGRRDLILGGSICTCSVCVAASLIQSDGSTSEDKWGWKADEKGLDARFARVMAGGMRDYEEMDEVQTFKTELFDNVKKGDLVLEVGVGPGPNLKFYGSRASTVLAVDPNRQFDSYARDAAAAANTELLFLPGRAEDIPMEDASVDVVVGTMVLCSVTSVEKSLKEVRRVLKPGGKYLFTEHTRAPKDWYALNFAQAVFAPLQLKLAEGCHLRRNPRGTMDKVFGSGNVHARSFVLSNTDRSPPWPPHFLLAPHLVGYAVKQ